MSKLLIKQALLATAIAAASFILAMQWERRSISEPLTGQKTQLADASYARPVNSSAPSQPGVADAQQRATGATGESQFADAASHELAAVQEGDQRATTASMRNNEDAAAVEEPDWYHLPVLSPEWVDSYMTDCQTPGGDSCSAEHDLAMQIASASEPAEDGWAQHIQTTIQSYFHRIAAGNNFTSVHTKCSQHGCLVYVAGDQRKIFGTGMHKGIGEIRFRQDLNRQPWLREFGNSNARRGTYRGFWSQEERWGLLLVFYP